MSAVPSVLVHGVEAVGVGVDGVGVGVDDGKVEDEADVAGEDGKDDDETDDVIQLILFILLMSRSCRSRPWTLIFSEMSLAICMPCWYT